MKEKDQIIHDIEDLTRDGVAFDDDVVVVLKKLSCADLFVLERAFRETFNIGKDVGIDSCPPTTGG